MATAEDICQDGSVLKTVLRAGEGTAHPPLHANVTEHHTGTLADGTVFDSSVTRGEPFEFKLGSGVITGWSDGVATMLRGEKSSFVIQPHKAYGAHGSPPTIPPNAALTFEIELLDWTTGEDVSPRRNKSIIKTVLHEGQLTECGPLFWSLRGGQITPPRPVAGAYCRFSKPADLSKVTATVVVRHGETVLYERVDPPATWAVDDGSVIPGLDEAVKHLKKGEKASFSIKAEHVPGGSAAAAAPFAALGPADVLTAEVELLAFDKEKDTWALSQAEKLAAMDDKRLLGNALFAGEDYPRAIRRYGNPPRTPTNASPLMPGRRYDLALKYFEYDQKLEGEMKKAVHEKKLPCLLNKAACLLKQRRFREASEACDQALALDAHNVKGLFRRATARLELGLWDEARRDFDACLTADPANKSAQQGLAALNAQVAAQNKKDKQRYAGMFDKLAGKN